MSYAIEKMHGVIHVQKERPEGNMSLVVVAYPTNKEPAYVLPIRRLEDEEFTVAEWRKFIAAVDEAINQAEG